MLWMVSEMQAMLGQQQRQQAAWREEAASWQAELREAVTAAAAAAARPATAAGEATADLKDDTTQSLQSEAATATDGHPEPLLDGGGAASKVLGASHSSVEALAATGGTASPQRGRPILPQQGGDDDAHSDAGGQQQQQQQQLAEAAQLYREMQEEQKLLRQELASVRQVASSATSRNEAEEQVAQQRQQKLLEGLMEENRSLRDELRSAGEARAAAAAAVAAEEEEERQAAAAAAAAAARQPLAGLAVAGLAELRQQMEEVQSVAAAATEISLRGRLEELLRGSEAASARRLQALEGQMAEAQKRHEEDRAVSRTLQADHLKLEEEFRQARVAWQAEESALNAEWRQDRLQREQLQERSQGEAEAFAKAFAAQGCELAGVREEVAAVMTPGSAPRAALEAQLRSEQRAWHEERVADVGRLQQQAKQDLELVQLLQREEYRSELQAHTARHQAIQEDFRHEVAVQQAQLQALKARGSELCSQLEVQLRLGQQVAAQQSEDFSSRFLALEAQQQRLRNEALEAVEERRRDQDALHDDTARLQGDWQAECHALQTRSNHWEEMFTNFEDSIQKALEERRLQQEADAASRKDWELEREMLKLELTQAVQGSRRESEGARDRLGVELRRLEQLQHHGQEALQWEPAQLREEWTGAQLELQGELQNALSSQRAALGAIRQRCEELQAELEEDLFRAGVAQQQQRDETARHMAMLDEKGSLVKAEVREALASQSHEELLQARRAELQLQEQAAQGMLAQSLEFQERQWEAERNALEWRSEARDFSHEVAELERTCSTDVRNMWAVPPNRTASRPRQHIQDALLAALSMSHVEELPTERQVRPARPRSANQSRSGLKEISLASRSSGSRARVR